MGDRVTTASTDNEAPRERDAGRNKETVWDLAISVGFLGLMALLAGNIGVVAMARQYNDAACKSAVSAAAQAAVSGEDNNGVMRAAMIGLNNCAPGVFFVAHPIFTKFKDETANGGRSLRIETTALVSVPAPFLMPNAVLGQDGRLPVSRSYECRIGGATGSSK